VLLIPITLLLVYPLGEMGVVYTGVALVLGITFAMKAWSLMKTPTDQHMARSLFKYSILYMMLLCTGMAVDSLPITHAATAAVADNLNALFSVVFSSRG
jgi:protoheme IX farnesyltransferase